jgi:ribosomal protein S18 acetylase RimI-like enzyme
VDFRRAEPDDAERVSALIMTFQASLTIDPTGAGAEKFLASVSTEAERSYIQSDRYRFLLAENDGELAGFIAMRDRTHVFHLFVAPKYQRRGLARELWLRARAAAESDGPAEEFTVNSSIEAVPVYERFGFRTCSEPVQESGIICVPMQCGRGDGVA